MSNNKLQNGVKRAYPYGLEMTAIFARKGEQAQWNCLASGVLHKSLALELENHQTNLVTFAFSQAPK